MNDEPEIQSIIIQTLASDPVITANFPGGVWNRAPVEGAPGVRGSTPGVWDESGRMRNVVWVDDGGNYDAPFAEYIGGRVSSPEINALAHAGDDGRAALGELRKQVLLHFGRTNLTFNNGTRGLCRFEYQMPIEDAAERGWRGMIFTVLRLEVVGWEPALLR